MSSVSETRAPDGPVLVIEDEEVVRSVACRMLEAIGRETTSAATGAEAVSAIETSCPVAVLLDLTLPDMAAGDVLRAIRKSCPNTFVVLTSGYQEADVTRDLDTGGAPFLPKPFNIQDLERYFACVS